MRDSSRIDPIIEQIRDVWKQQPDLRLGQLLVVMARPASPCSELFHLEDEQLVHRLADYKNALEHGQDKLRYVKRRWEESRGDKHDQWGHSSWYFEIDAIDNVVRQIEAYDKRPTIGYDQKHDSDEFGGLSQSPLENVIEDYEPVTPDTFNQLWGDCSNRN